MCITITFGRWIVTAVLRACLSAGLRVGVVWVYGPVCVRGVSSVGIERLRF